MPIRFFNTLTRAKEPFEPLEPPKVRMYTCGPTVYNFAHIGNLRTFLFEDLLRRHLKYRGFQVMHVMNLTDVEDKIIRACRETGESLKSLTSRYTQAFFEDLDTLGIERAEVYPAATDHIPEMVDMIKKLRERGHTYEAEGSIYFKLSTFPEYGKLSKFKIDELKAGASGRVDSDEYETEDARDFALWKAYDDDDGEIYWETELGKGRPGWHIECSCMSMKYLGDSFDIHCGGVDNMFPHHENEIAQSEAATGTKPFVRYWLHSAHLFVDGRKMSKSLGNIYTLRDLAAKGYDPKAIRWVLISTHYRQPSNFTMDALEAAGESLRRVRDFRRRLADVRGEGDGIGDAAAKCETAFGEALDDDLNISGAIGVVFEFIRDANRLIDRNALGSAGAQAALALLDRLDAVTGLFGGVRQDVPQNVLDLVKERQQARRAKDFKRSDEIRDKLAADGWIVEDTADGPRVKKA